MNREIIIEGLHMELTEDLKRFVTEKADKLFNHQAGIIRMRMELEHNKNQVRGKQEQFRAKGSLLVDSIPMIVNVGSEEIHKSIDQVITKLDRKLRRRSRLKRVKRHRIKPIEIPADLPKMRAA